ncbi:AGE family epimerase/isomerase [Phreatobacter stygius]|uniref:Mannose-6-phosphate isomerase n=1 Tax=Phreatobacter stygius TaxID=1940610 RepID=A0A4D7B3A6_9HYPH|nr:AGE family epimerase/isomerase [Phreatobacter stygius]QCI64076.1 hypothetical protein E8M01_07335 [Phreatobacter stygius]
MTDRKSGGAAGVPTDIRAWLTQVLVPAWAAAVADPRRPGFVELMRPGFTPVLTERRTTLVTARLIYVFSHGHYLDPAGPGLAAARHGLDFLLGACRGPDGRFRHAVTAAGEVIDGRSDLYDLAFVLFGLGWYARASGDLSVLRVADDVAGFIEANLAHAAGGFAEDTLQTLPRRQNPHMHLLEAFLLLAEVAPESPWLGRATGMVDLLRAHLFDAETGSLGEFFTDDWRPAEGPSGAIREPGHHFEWCWLIHHYARLGGDASVLAMADRLFAFGRAHGLAAADPVGAAFDEIDRSGQVIKPSKRLWPQTELLKALTARLEFGRDDQAGAAIDQVLALIFRHYVEAGSGRWLNQLDAAGQPVSADVPVRVLYHLVFALAELARVRPEAGA